MAFPLVNSSELNESNSRDCGRSSCVGSRCARSRSPGSVTEFPNPLDRGFVGLKGVAIAWDRTHNFLQKFQRRVDVLVTMKRHKTTREQFRHCLAGRELGQHVAVTMLQN